MPAQSYAILPVVCNLYLLCTCQSNTLFPCKSPGASSCVFVSGGKCATIVALGASHGRSLSEF